MSIKLFSLVWDVQSLSQARKMLLLSLADNANDEGSAWPSVETIMRRTGFKSESGVRSAIKELESDGWLRKSSRSTKAANGRRQQGSNLYQINISKLKTEAEKGEIKRFQPAPYDGSCHEGSQHERSRHERSYGDKKQSYEPAPDAPNPSVTSKQEPSLKSKPLCQVAGQPDPEVILTEQARDVLTHLNQTTGSRFTTNKSSLEHIRARLREGFTVAELNLVVDYKSEDWRGTEQEQYLRPATLFIPKNFPGYLQKAGKWDKAGRPHRINGRWSKPGERVITEIDTPDQSTPAGFRGA